MAKGYEKYVQRVGHTTKNMSKRLPKPNVCRIEVLDGAARRAYMGGIQKSIDAFRETMLDAISKDSGYDMYEPFYGILNADTGNGPSIDVSASWQPPSGNKSGFARMSTLLTGGGGNAGLLGAIPGVGATISSAANTALGAIEGVAQMGMELSGVNNQCTGSMTIKKFSGATIGASLPLKFQWYLPEQEDMCRLSIKRLIMMTYVRPMDMRGYDIVNAMINGLMSAGGQLADGAKDLMKKLSDSNYSKADEPAKTPDANQTTASNGGGGYKDGNSTASNSSSASESGAWKTIKESAKIVVGSGVDIYNSLNTFFGGEIVANPLPVRVSIGHYLDLEPMVIDKVKISTSNEQFISADGTHLPVFVNADVTVSYWMQPGPTKDFISILGNEVFGQFVQRENSNAAKSTKNAKDGKTTRNNNPRKNKKR